MSIEFKARREGEKDRWLGLWTQQRPPLILHWVSICFASLPKAITQLPFFHPFLWEPLAFFLPVNRSFLHPWKVVYRCGPSLPAVIRGSNYPVDRVPSLCLCLLGSSTARHLFDLSIGGFLCLRTKYKFWPTNLFLPTTRTTLQSTWNLE